MRVFLAVFLPSLPLEVFRPTWSPESACGSVVLEKDKVAFVDKAAHAAGVRLGMKRGGVLTLSPATEMHERDIAREDSTLREVSIALMQFSPDVALLDEATIVVEVGASLRLFGGLRAIYRRVKAVLSTLGVTSLVSSAPTGRGAWLLARYGDKRVLQLKTLERALSLLPMQSVPELRPFEEWFSGLGCTSIADIRRLPRPGLQRRCGERLLDSLDRAFGTAPELFEWLELPPTFSARIELPDRLEHAEGAMFAAHRLIVQLCGWLCGKQLAMTGLTLSLEHERGREAIPPTPIEIALGEPTWREGHIVRLLKERLHRIELMAPVIALRLDASKVQPAEAGSDSLFPEPGGSPEDHARLMELLVARLGPENVTKPAPVADYRPETANQWLSVTQIAHKSELPIGLPRPTWLLGTPVKLLTRQHRPFYGSSLRKVSPSERIEAGWFDGRLVTRDYFVAQGEDWSYYWIYRERVSSRDVDEEPQWFLHGLFG